jgi:hypothetical protein
MRFVNQSVSESAQALVKFLIIGDNFDPDIGKVNFITGGCYVGHFSMLKRYTAALYTRREVTYELLGSVSA